MATKVNLFPKCLLSGSSTYTFQMAAFSLRPRHAATSANPSHYLDFHSKA